MPEYKTYTGLFYFKITVNDGTTEYIFYADRIEWPFKGDGFIVAYVPAIPTELAEVIDGWEENGTELQVSIEPICDKSLGTCPPDFWFEYNSQEGTAKVKDPRCFVNDSETHCLGWRYNPFGESEIPFLFSEYE